MKGLPRIALHISASDQPPSRADVGADASRSAVFVASINSLLDFSSALVVPTDTKNMRSTSALWLWIPGGAQLLAPHIPELRISSNMWCTAYLGGWAKNARILLRKSPPG